MGAVTKRRFKARELSATRKFEGEITASDLRKRFNIPEDADIVVRVPGGGDWSNTHLDLDEHPIRVTWEEVKR